MAQWIKAFVVADDLSLNPRIQVKIEGENHLHKTALCGYDAK